MGKHLDWDVLIHRVIRQLEAGEKIPDIAKELGVCKETIIIHLSDYRLDHPERTQWWPGALDLKQFPRRTDSQREMKRIKRLEKRRRKAEALAIEQAEARRTALAD